jgi:hypothetical protein
MVINKFHSNSIQDNDCIYFKRWCYFHNLIQLIRGCIWYIEKDITDLDKHKLNEFLNSLKYLDIVQKETITFKLLTETIESIQS